MPEARIRSSPDQELQYRNQEVRANGKTISTPIKSIDLSKVHPDVSLSGSVKFVNELYAGLSKEKLSYCITGSDHSLTYSLNQKQKRFRDTSNEMCLCFLEYKDDSIPTAKEVEYMTDQAYVYSDITPIPMLSDFVKRVTNTVDGNQKGSTPNPTKLERTMAYIQNAIETIEQLNNKPIMGYVPDYRHCFNDLVSTYADHGINTFYFDAHRSNPITLQAALRAFMRELNKQELLEQSFIHLINPNVGRAIKNNPVIPAKDILGYGLGIDSLGENHMRLVLPPQVIENMKKNPDNRSRLFNKESYGYIKTSAKSELEKFYPADSGIGMGHFLASGKPDLKIQNAFNVEQLALESSRLQAKIRDAESVLHYVGRKSNVKEDDLKILKRAKIKERR